MKKNKKYLAYCTIAIMFAYTSCEKSDVTEDEIIDSNFTEEIDLTGVKPDAVSKTYRFGKTVEEVFGKSRPTTLQAVTPWEQITKTEVREVGIADNQVFGVITDKFFSNYNPNNGQFYGVVSVALGPNSSQLYGYGNQWSNVSNPSLPEYRFYGQGDVSQNTGFSLWRRVPGVNAQVHPTNSAANQVWLTSAETTAHSFTVEASSSVTAGGKIGIPFVAQGEASATITLGASYTFSKEKTFEENFYFPELEENLRPDEDVRYVLEERWVPVQTEWKFPIQFRGNYAIGVEIGQGESGSWTEEHKVNVNAFNSDYDQPDKYHTIKVEEYLSHEVRVAAYIIPDS